MVLRASARRVPAAATCSAVPAAHDLLGGGVQLGELLPQLRAVVVAVLVDGASHTASSSARCSST
jgi:hypothetical protein